MDYDKSDIATHYDEARALTPERLRQWSELISTSIDAAAVSLVVDLGCGTGRFSELLAAHLGALVIGIDPSQKMIGHARRKRAAGSVLFQRAAAGGLPLAHGCVDLVFMSQADHHVTDAPAVARECRRVLREGGYVCIRNTTREDDFAYRHFFPAMQPLIESELPSRQHIERTFMSAGFAVSVHQIVTQVVAPDWLTFVGKSALRADSFLARLPTHEFDAGMSGLRARAAKARPEDSVTEEIDWFMFTRSA
jgi:ubiquinone/menaquinone biosynthesis C-methylase UbiE